MNRNEGRRREGRKQVKYKAFGGILSFFFSVVGKSQMKKE